jgi:hypothetical protein
MLYIPRVSSGSKEKKMVGELAKILFLITPKMVEFEQQIEENLNKLLDVGVLWN